MHSTLAAIAAESTSLSAQTFIDNIYDFGGEAATSGWRYGVKRKLGTAVCMSSSRYCV